MSGTFVCAACGQRFPTNWTDADAEAEMRSVFGDLPANERASVCDSCYRAIMDKARAEGWPPFGEA